MYGGHLKTALVSEFAKFRFCLNLGICLNWGRVQTCPSRSGLFTTRAIQGVTTRTRRSGVFLTQIALKVQVLLRSFVGLFPHLPKKKEVAGSFSGVLSSWKLPLKYEVVHDALFPPYNGFGIIRTISIELGPPKKRVELRTTTKK